MRPTLQEFNLMAELRHEVERRKHEKSSHHWNEHPPNVEGVTLSLQGAQNSEDSHTDSVCYC